MIRFSQKDSFLLKKIREFFIAQNPKINWHLFPLKGRKENILYLSDGEIIDFSPKKKSTSSKV